jgi:hypothetical protein
VASALAVMGAGSVVAYAFFSSTGSGNGAASVGSAVNTWGVAVSTDTSNSLYPGSGSETLTYTITNTGAGHQELNSVTVTVPNSGSCLGSWFTATDNGSTNGVTLGAASADLANGGFDTGTITVTMQDSGSPQDACQGISPTVHVVAG